MQIEMRYFIYYQVDKIRYSSVLVRVPLASQTLVVIVEIATDISIIEINLAKCIKN